MGFVRLLLALMGPAALVGALSGLIFARHYLDAGFPLLCADAVRRTIWRTLLGTAVFVALYEPLRRLAERLTKRFAVPLAAGLAGAPFVAYAGYALNRARAIRPAELLEPYALVPNLKLLLGCAVAWAVAAFFLHGLAARTGRPPLGIPAAVLALLLGLELVLPRLQAERATERPDVLVLLVDALRADHLSSYGYGRETTPSIDSLAGDGVLFRQAIAQSTFTKTSIASLFTGRYPFRHGIYWGQRQLADQTLQADLLGEAETTLAEALHKRNYLTAAWVQNSHLRRIMGFAQGFVEYHDQQGSIERIHRRFFPWLAGPARNYPTFAYLHYIDLHDPYRPKPPYDTLFGTYSDVYAGVDFRRWGDFLRAVRNGEKKLSEDDVEQLRSLYDGQLRAVDDEIGRLLERLRRTGRYDETLIVLTSDHGDAFMEHGFISHSWSPYDELVRVPLIVKLPGGRFAGRVIEDQVRLIDVMPTLLEVLGIPLRGLELDGCSLLPLMAGGEIERKECGHAVIEIAEDEASYPTFAIRTERYKYIHWEHRPDEVYDLLEDPGERHDLSGSLNEETERLKRLALQLLKLRDTDGVERMELDEKTKNDLRALGYL